MMKILAWTSAKIKRQRPKKSRIFQFSADSSTLNSRTAVPGRNRQDSRSSEFGVRSSEFQNAGPETRSILVDAADLGDAILVLEVAE